MAASRKLAWALGSALVLSNLAWAYCALDQGLTSTYQGDELGRLTALAARQDELLVALPRDLGVDGTAEFLRTRYPKALITVRRPDTLELDELKLIFRRNSLVRVEHF